MVKRFLLCPKDGAATRESKLLNRGDKVQLILNESRIKEKKIFHYIWKRFSIIGKYKEIVVKKNLN